MLYLGFNKIDPTVAQWAEATDLKSVKCEFESHQWDQLLKIRLKKFKYKNYIYKAILRKRKIIDNCWIWTGARRTVYGSIKIDGRVVDIHRFIVHLFYDMELYGSINLACHTLNCQNKLCFHPDHLYKGTTLTNTSDSIKMGTHHVYGKKIR